MIATSAGCSRGGVKGGHCRSKNQQTWLNIPHGVCEKQRRAENASRAFGPRNWKEWLDTIVWLSGKCNVLVLEIKLQMQPMVKQFHLYYTHLKCVNLIWTGAEMTSTVEFSGNKIVLSNKSWKRDSRKGPLHRTMYPKLHRLLSKHLFLAKIMDKVGPRFGYLKGQPPP